MSLGRFDSSSDILNATDTFHVTEYAPIELNSIGNRHLISEIKSLSEGSIYTEIHIYSTDGDYINSTYNNTLIIDSDNNSLFVDVREVFNVAGISRGSYKILVNCIEPVFGQPSSTNSDYFYVDGISPDRTEIKLKLNNSRDNLKLQEFREYILTLDFEHIINFLVVNFYENQIYKIVNLRFDQKDPNAFYIKLYSPLQDDVEETRTGWIGLELFDTYVDQVNLIRKIDEPAPIKIKGPNFDINQNIITSNETSYKNWNELLDSNLKTSQGILDSIFSGSAQAAVNIDYTDFNNFVFYGNATDRIKNFMYKIELVENYETQLNTLLSSENTNSNSVKTNVDKFEKRISTVKESFDSFERWLYYTPTGSSTFTHDISGSVEPYPKYLEDDKYVYNSYSSSVASEWYDTSIEIAKEYDTFNYNSLWWSIPEFILRDKGNSEYLLFVSMIGQHFDNMYMYINALTQIHEKDEHPQRGSSSDLLYHIAKSYGWDLQNSRSLSDLWTYKLGNDQSGSILHTSGAIGSDEEFDVPPHEYQAHIIWKRIVNNLPGLLKSKGTARSINAMMSIYGIPQTLISIREHGGPGLRTDVPIKIQDTFGYKLNLSEQSYIRIPQDKISAATFGWRSGSICEPEESFDVYERVPDTYEFRFSTLQSGSLDAIPLLIQAGSGDSVLGVISLMSSKLLDDIDFVSGSKHYGKVVYETSGNPNQYAMSEYLPVFDGDVWTIRLSDINQFAGNVAEPEIHVARTRDCLYGRISQESKFKLDSGLINTSNVTNIYLAPSGSFLSGFNSEINSVSYSSSFDGSVQSYKEYFTTYSDETFYNHVRNPNSYNVDSISGSFYSLYRYYPLGLDMRRYDHTTETEISSSHPDQRHHTPTACEFLGFGGDKMSQYTYFNETFYSTVPKIGDESINSEKIRIESADLVSTLSPENRAELAEFDDATVDGNRLIIAFSTADSVNNDIINHMGIGSLDKFFGNPKYEFEDNYHTLHYKSFEYFQKYKKKNDINNLIRLLSLYDYTFFEQIKQLVPVKADLIAGILIEPHILERSKVKISNRPSVEQLQHDDNIKHETKIQGEIEDLEDVIRYKTKLTGEHDILHTNISDKLVFLGEDFEVYYGSVNVYKNEHSGSVFGVIDDHRPDCRYKRKICYYDAYPFETALNTNARIDTLDNYTLSDIGSVVLTNPDLEIGNTNHSSQFKYAIEIPEGESATLKVPISKLSGGELNGSGSSEYYKFDVPKYIFRFFALPKEPDDQAVLSLEMEVGGVNKTFEYIIKRREVDNKLIVTEYRHQLSEFSPGQVGDGLDPNYAYITIKSIENTINLFSFGIYKKFNKWEEGWLKRTHQNYNHKAGCVSEEWYYQINECSSQNNSRYRGSKLVGAAVNVDSSNTVDGGPVVVIKQTNPNQIKRGFGDSEGNLIVE